MIALERFELLRSHATSSWAVWSNVGDNTASFFRNQLETLHGGVVFVGLNRSNSWSVDISDRMANFHSRGHVGDARLKRQIQDADLSRLIGGFMTDLSEEIETDSGRVKLTPADAVAAFKLKVIGLDKNRARDVICFGDKVFETFRKGLGVKTWAVSEYEPELKGFERKVEDEVWRFHRVWHYSNYGKLLSKAEAVLPIQLQMIDKLAPVE